MANCTAPVRIEILLDGRRVATAGIEEMGVISAVVTWCRRNPSDITPKMRSDPTFDELQFLREICEVELGAFDSAREKHLFWAKEALRLGSEVIIRILGPGEFDPPKGRGDDV